MNDYILLIYNDAVDAAAADDGEKWNQYLSSLRLSGCFDGGSAIGHGLKVRKGHPEQPSSPDLTGFIRVRADSLAKAQAFLVGNPAYEAGGTVEVRELPRDQ